MKLLIINGVNLNMLGIREPDVYGKNDYKHLVKLIKKHAKEKKVKVDFFISNSESCLVERIQKAYQKYDGIIINPGAYSHYSIAILDALKAINIPYIEVHISDIMHREEFRQKLVTATNANKVIIGEGFDGYLHAIDEFIRV